MAECFLLLILNRGGQVLLKSKVCHVGFVSFCLDFAVGRVSLGGQFYAVLVSCVEVQS